MSDAGEQTDAAKVNLEHRKPGMQSFPWRLTKRAFMLFDPTDKPKYGIHWGAVRMFIVIMSFALGWLAGIWYQNNQMDFGMDYPPTHELHSETLWISIEKARGASYILFKEQDETIHSIDPARSRDFLPIDWFRDEHSQMVWRKARVAKFQMPSGVYWLASLELNGHLLADYARRKRDFYAYKAQFENAYIARFFALHGYQMGFLTIALAYLAAWIQLRGKENTDE